VARAVGRSGSTVHAWRRELEEKLVTRERQRREFYRRDPSFRFSAATREDLELILDGADAPMVASAIDDAENAASFYRDYERKQTREPGKNARGPNRQARNRLAGRLEWSFDVAYRGAERDRRNRKAEFVSVVLGAVGAPPLGNLEFGEMPTSAESWAVWKTPDPSAGAIDLGRALRSGVPLLKDRIWEEIRKRAAAAGVSVSNRYAEEHPEGRELSELMSGEFRDEKWVSHFFTPIDTARKDAALNEKCRRLGVSLDERRV
jgi:hypothetical protein